jgi:hypothetical protein
LMWCFWSIINSTRGFEPSRGMIFCFCMLGSIKSFQNSMGVFLTFSLCLRSYFLARYFVLKVMCKFVYFATVFSPSRVISNVAVSLSSSSSAVSTFMLSI